MVIAKENKLEKVLSEFPLFAKNFIFITDNENQVVKFELNDAQLEIYELLKNNRFINIMKARQSGITTMMIAMGLWRCLTKPNENILIVSYKGDSAKAIFERLKTINSMIPREKYPNLFPKVRRDNRSELLFDNNSRITSVTAGNKSIGRGSTYSLVLLSEFAFYSNQETQLLSIEQALAKGEHSRLIVESTSNGVSNYHYRLSIQSLKGESKYIAYFVPFFHKLYKKQFAFERNESEIWYKATNKGKRLSVEDLDDDEKVLYDFGADLKSLMWRKWKLLDLSSEEFQQEFPHSPISSFLSTGQSVFDQTKVLQRLSYAIEPLPKSEIITQLPESVHKYIGKGLDIFYLPQRNKKMFFGVDTASGSGKDFSTISAFDEDGQQVLSFYHNKIPIYEFAQVIYDLGIFYNYAFLTVERNSYGLPLIERLRKEKGYLNMMKMKTFDERGKKKLQIGFLTSEKTKAIMITDMKEQFELGLINIECKVTLQQMQMFVETNGKLGNKRGNSDLHHDDSVIAVGLAIQGMKQGKWYV